MSQYVCGCTEQFGDGTPALKLQTNRPVVFVQDSLPGASQDTVWSWLKEAYARWGAVCDWKGERIGDLSDAKPTDYVHLITAADLGTSGVLADQQLPYSGGRILRMRINGRIRWKATDGQMAGGTVDPIRTLCHETGHYQGHSHWPVGAPAELMEPTVSQKVIGPQPTEGKVSAGWFGSPSGAPTPPPPGDFDFSKIILDFASATAVRVDLEKTAVELANPVGLKLTDAKGNVAEVSWQG